jgi:hypothetical protein
MAKINPVEMSETKNEIQRCQTGSHVLVALGMEYFDINDKPVADVRFVSVDGDSAGSIHTETFWLNDKSLWRVAKFAVALGWTEPFDPEDQEDFEQVLSYGPVRCQVKVQEVNGYDRSRIEKFSRYSMDRDPTTGAPVFSSPQDKLIKMAEEQWAGYLRWRSNNPRKTGGGSVSNSQNNGVRSKAEYDEDVPF